MAGNNIPKLGSEESVKAFKGAIELDHLAGAGGFVSELTELYKLQDPVPLSYSEEQIRMDIIYKAITRAFNEMI